MAGAAEPVIVVGGGIGGLAAGLALARKGIKSRVLEQAPEFKEIGAGIQLGPNVFKMFARLGLTEDVSRIAWFPDRLVMMDCVTAKEVTRITLGDDFRAAFRFPYALIHRADLHQVILEACRNAGLVSLETSRKVTGVAEQATGVSVTLADGSKIEGAALIGCDGLWSTVRQHVVGDGDPRVSGHIAYRAVLPTHEVPETMRVGSMVIWAGEKTHLVHYPLRSGELTNLVAVFHSNRYEEGWDSYGDPAELHERFAGTCSEVRTMLGKIEEWRMWVLCDREPIKDWCRGRVTLLGDAAHPMLQYLAQGACMAIEDAVCVADKAVERQGDFAAAFRDYNMQRYLRTGRVQIMARVYGEFYHASGVARELRNIMLGSRSQADGIAGMQWLYGGPDFA
ncbi:MAG TPA: 3-hydroxybenzoate 6-monooxygenase [Stellaceae bacterium]|nr:3-hydroxybenzoate 6-monooxygenase [Stellaceae bacterium]